jgi:formylglycine-generating enzyme required for sulfatase activity
VAQLPPPAQAGGSAAPLAEQSAANGRVGASALDVPAFDNATRDCDAICPRLVLIPKGEFTIGVPDAESRREGFELADNRAKPTHSVTIGRQFYLSETPVTRGEYNQCVKAGKCKAADTPSFTQTDNDPVVNVSYDDAVSYAGWLKALTGKDYRLPSETEWEYAARAGTQTARYWGDDFDDRRGDTVPRARQATMPVKSFPPNKFGLYDMLGNVWQWTEDCWNDDYRGNQPTDERPRNTGGCWARVLRGGSWYSNAKLVRAAIRDRYNAGFRYAYTGFRVARNH